MRTISSNDLPVDGTTGNFPISSSDDAYSTTATRTRSERSPSRYSLDGTPQKGSAACIGGQVGIARTAS